MTHQNYVSARKRNEMTRSHLHGLEEPRKAIFAKWSWTWLSRGSYEVFVTITGSTWLSS